MYGDRVQLMTQVNQRSLPSVVNVSDKSPTPHHATFISFIKSHVSLVCIMWDG